MTRERELQTQLRAIKFLRALKHGRTYHELSHMLNISPIVLNRYVKGHVLPELARAEQILAFCTHKELAQHAQQLLTFDEDGFIDNTALLADTSFLATVADLVASRFPNTSKVLTAAVDGLPLAVLVAAALSVPCLFAKREREIGASAFIESRYKLSGGQMVNYFLPAAILRPNDRVLIVDDLIRSGETQAVLLEMVQMTKAIPVGIFLLIQIGEEGVLRLQKSVFCPIEALVILD
ncbi:adenine phosphoribosyltransferase [Candidatus Acetothermia bacterium]|nr:adenine phosphoribosyltransferase [Candidatus Acetothermia bacterium]